MKKMFKIIGIIILVLIAGIFIKNFIDNLNPAVADKYWEKFEAGGEIEKKYAGLGNFEVELKEYDSDDSMIKKFRFWSPKADGKYPVVLVVNASNTPAKKYEPFFERLASWGFVVVGNEDGGAGNGESANKTLEFILNSDDGKLDKEKIGVVGFSQGGAGAIRVATEYKNSDKISTLFTSSAAYPTLAKNMGWEYDASKITIPCFMTAGTGNSDDNGVDDIENNFGGVSPLKALIENYDKISVDVLKVRARAVSAEHEQMLERTSGYMTAWLRYQLLDDENAAKAFIGDDAELLTNKKWQDIKISE